MFNSMEVKICKDKREYEDNLKSLDGPFMQSWAWGQFKRSMGWEPQRILVYQNNEIVAAASYLIHSLILNMAFAYFPKGPVFKDGFDKGSIIRAVMNFIKDNHKDVVFCRIESDLLDNQENHDLYTSLSLRKVDTAMQYKATRKLVLLSEEEVWNTFSSKQRNKIKQGPKRGVEISKTSDITIVDSWYELFKQTSKRGMFAARAKEYYENFFKTFVIENDMADFWGAFYENKLIAGAFIVRYGREASYLYSASTIEHRNLRPGEALQWEIIKSLIKGGVKVYDFWGVAPTTDSNHPWFGLSKFKASFGGEYIEYMGAYDYPLHSVEYAGYRSAETLRKSKVRVRNAVNKLRIK